MSASGYSAEMPQGTLEIVGASPTDEIFTHEDFGMINITQAWSLVPAGAKPFRVPLNQNIIDHLQFRDFNPTTMESMTAARMREPVLSVFLPFNTQLIDGAHRIEKRRLGGKTWYSSFLLQPEALEICQVKLWLIAKDGSRSELDARKANLHKMRYRSP